MFHLCNDQYAFSHVSANTPDVVVVNEESREVSVLEIVCTFDTSLEEAFMTKVLKYQPLVNPISELGYRCALLVFVFGSPGHVHMLIVRDYDCLGCPKRKLKGSPSFALSLQLLAAAMAEMLLLVPMSDSDVHINCECRLKCAFIICVPVCIVSMRT